MAEALWVRKASPVDEFDSILFAGSLHTSRAGRLICEIVVIVHRDGEGDVVHEAIADLSYGIVHDRPFSADEIAAKADRWLESRDSNYWDSVVQEHAGLSSLGEQ